MKNSNSASTELNRGKELLREGNLSEAEGIFRGLIDQGLLVSEAWNQLGIVQIHRNKPEEASVFFERSIAVNPQNPAPYSNLGALAHERGDLEQAMQYCQRALDLDPDYPPALHNMGVIYRKKGNLWKSVSFLKRSAKADIRRKRSTK